MKNNTQVHFFHMTPMMQVCVQVCVYAHQARTPAWEMPGSTPDVNRQNFCRSATSPGASRVKSETGPPCVEGGEILKRKAGPSTLGGDKFSKQADLLMRLVLGTQDEPTSTPVHQILKVHVEALTGFSHTTNYLKAMSLEQPLGAGKAIRIHSPRTEQKPLRTRVQLMGQPVVTSSR